ncbi:MAG: aconitate hydratase [Vampirovibrionales bacterium]|nr:aconitate hydratase [Vampirovibrionales bacterium]
MSAESLKSLCSPELVKAHYQAMADKLEKAKKALGKEALTAVEKALFSHFVSIPESLVRGESFLQLQPDRVAMQDATAQMAILQFMQAKRDTVAVPSTVHCDHLVRAQSGAAEDVARAVNENKEVYEFLRSAAAKYGMGFWKPGSGIIHQVVLENYAFPGGLMIGTDSHTPNAGGLGMIAIGVGGADAADVMAGLPWEVKAPKLIGVHLTGKLNGWAAPKDVILYLCGLLTTKGGTNKILEYFGEGAQSISCTGKGTITNMGAELGATTSFFPYDKRMAAYLKATKRADIAALADEYQAHLVADPEVLANPKAFYDEVVEINLSELEPYVVGPHTPDRARKISDFAKEVAKEGFPASISAGLIGSCTNSSYEDMERSAHVARQAMKRGLKSKSYLLITPGSEQIHETIKRDGQLETFQQVGATVMANACGPCIGNWDRSDIKKGETNAIVSSFNRNFPKRNDGNAETLSFITSPELVIAFAIAGKTTFNPMTDTLEDGTKLEPPVAPELPEKGFAFSSEGYIEAPEFRHGLQVSVDPMSKRLEILNPFSAWDGKDFIDVPVLVKTKGQTTTDHISPAGKDWLPLRGHLSGISHNMLLGAVDADTGKPADTAMMDVCGVQRGASAWALKAMELKDKGGSIIIGDENYGEGSSREHAAMSPRFLGVKAVIARSFARIHETNLKKQGVLPLVFSSASDYEQVKKGDLISISGLSELTPGKPVKALVKKADGAEVTLELKHSLNAEQIKWFRAGSAMNAANRPEAAAVKPIASGAHN